MSVKYLLYEYHQTCTGLVLPSGSITQKDCQGWTLSRTHQESLFKGVLDYMFYFFFGSSERIWHKFLARGGMPFPHYERRKGIWIPSGNPYSK